MIKIMCVELTGQRIISLQFHVGDNLIWKPYEKNNNLTFSIPSSQLWMWSAGFFMERC